MLDDARARTNMVNTQLETNGISSQPLLDAYLTTPRAAFLPPALQAAAYLDEDRLSPEGVYTLEPLIEARLLEHALYGAEQWGEDGADNVLFLGTNALPAVAILAQLCAHVHVLEPDASAREHAKAKLTAAHIENVTLHDGDCEEGLVDVAPFDAIILPGATTYIPDMLLDQLAENGRFVCVHRPSAYEVGRILSIVRMDGERFTTQYVADAATLYAPEFAPKSQFAF